jgi:3-dehydroquinate synthase
MKIHVNFAERSYDILIQKGLRHDVGEILKQSLSSKRLALISGEKAGALYQQELTSSLETAGFQVFPLIIKSGEMNKNMQTVSAIYDFLLANKFDRGSAVIALGGGIIGDMAGFAAATIFRGISFVQIPTTLLAQVDSSIGGKTGVNHALGKNLIGAFYQPKAVLIDPQFLKTLPPRELLCGYAEMLKMALIADADLAETLWLQREKLLNPILVESTSQLIFSAIQIKKAIVEADETESGRRMLLNFGHTIGHAIENVSGYGNILHGEAVLMGMIAALHLSFQHKFLSDAQFTEWTQRFHQLLLERLPFTFSKEKILTAMRLDKKISNGLMKFILLKTIGKGIIIENISLTELHDSLDFLEENLSYG